MVLLRCFSDIEYELRVARSIYTSVLNCLLELLVSSRLSYTTYCLTSHLIISSFEYGLPCPPVSPALSSFISFLCTSILTKMGYNPSISVTLPLAYSSDKRVLLFVCVLGETCFLHLDLEGSAYFVLSLPDCLFQNTDFLLVVCYVVRCYISLIWPEASQHRDFFRSILFYLFVPGALFPGKSSGFIEVDSCSLSLKNMKSRPIRPRPPFHPLSLIHPDVF